MAKRKGDGKSKNRSPASWLRSRTHQPLPSTLFPSDSSHETHPDQKKKKKKLNSSQETEVVGSSILIQNKVILRMKTMKLTSQKAE